MFWQAIFSITVLTLMTLSEAEAQTYLEVRGGLTVNQLNQGFESTAFENMEPANGSYVAIMVAHRIKKTLLLQFGSELIQKNYCLRRASPFNSIYVQSNNYFLQIPLSAGLTVVAREKLQLAIISGVFGGYWLSSASRGTIPNAFDSFNTFVDGNVIQNFRVSEYSNEKRSHTT